MPASPDVVRDALTAYAQTLETIARRLSHPRSQLHLRLPQRAVPSHTLLVPDYRAVGLGLVEEARRLRADADARAAAARATLARRRSAGGAARRRARLRRVQLRSRADARAHERRVRAQPRPDSSTRRTSTRARASCSARDWRRSSQSITPSIESPVLSPVTGEFASMSRAIHEAYAHHVVGF